MEILILFLLICLNGIFAMSEIAVVSSRKVRLEQAAGKGNLGARLAVKLVESPTRFLSTVQIGITMVGIFAGAYGEATIAADLAARLEQVPSIAPYSRIVATAIVILCITYLSLVIGELVPKRLALNAPEKIAALVAPPMQVLSRIAAPFVHLLTVSTDLIVKLFPRASTDDEMVTEQDIKDLIEKGTEAGVFQEQERELVDRIFRLGDQQVSALMVPRADIIWLESDAPTERVRIAVATSSHSHFPVCQQGLDNIVGVVHLKDMVQSGLLTKAIDLKTLAQKPIFIPETMPALRLVEEFRKLKQHIAFIHDEYGVLVGLITLNDVVEGMLGHMSKYGETEELLKVQREDGSWLLDGTLPVADLREILAVDALPHENRTKFQTLAGFVMTYLGRIPHTGDTFTWERFRFEIVDMDRHRIDKVLLTVQRPKRPPEDLATESAE